MKDPAFLFYSKEFYEGTRMMFPDERACYVDLMIYQHQNGEIPDDINRLLLYCSGINEATLKTTLKAKFKLTNKGWINLKLKTIIDERKEFIGKQSINGKVGQFWKKSKLFLSSDEYKKLHKVLSDKGNDEILEIIKDIEFNKATLKALLEALLKHYTITDSIINLDLSFIPQNYIEIVNMWLEFKKKKHQSYKDADSIKVMFNHLIKLSENNIDTAKKIVEQSIANNYAGLFELKGYKKPDKPNFTQGLTRMDQEP